MLIRLYISNILSFNEDIEFSLIPGKGSINKNQIYDPKDPNDIRVLKGAILYGPNASGKSNLVKVIEFAKTLILKGTKPNEKILYKKFKLDLECESKKSRIEFEIKNNDKNYSYGFLLDNDVIHEEWLYVLKKRSEKCIFERKTLSDNSVKIDFKGIKFENEEEKQFLNFIAKGTRPNLLFLTECISRNVKSNVKNVTDIYNVIDWFSNKLKIIFPSTKFSGLEYEFENDIDIKKTFSEYLKKFDSGIDDIELREIELNSIKVIPKEVLEDILSEVNKSKVLLSNPADNYSFLFSKDKDVKVSKLMTKHRVINSDKYEYFEINEESDGTQRMFDLIPALIELFTNDSVFIIDELDRSLHPNLSKKLLELFFDKTAGMRSQLIVTTHETNLLDLKKIRKDEIWFVEKNKNGASEIYSLEEFKPRFDKELRKNYLLGRFGAIPKLTMN